MILRYLNQIVLTLLCFSSVAFGDVLVFEVTDVAGRPVENAVIEIQVQASPGAEANSRSETSVLVMDQVNKSFQPKVLVAPQHALVSFPNSDDIRHHVYSFSKAKTFELKLYQGKPKAPISFDQSGVVVLGCNIHDSMVGYIYVAESAYAGKSDQRGLVNLSLDSRQIASVTVWHPDQAGQPEERTILQLSPNQFGQGRIPVSITLREPEPRNTFRDVFRDAG